MDLPLPATIAAEFPTYAPADQALVRALLAAGQAHLFAGWRAGADAAAKAAFFDSVRALEANYPGGVVAYASNARELLRSSAAGENPFAGMKPEMPDLVRLAYASPEFAATEEVGLALVRDSAFVLVAGGLGERLGYTDIKVSLPVQVRGGGGGGARGRVLLAFTPSGGRRAALAGHARGRALRRAAPTGA